MCPVPLPPQGAGGVLTDFASFYTLPSTVMHHPLHRSLKAAYSFYNVHTQTPLLDLMNDALILAKLVIPRRRGTLGFASADVGGSSFHVFCVALTERVRRFQRLGPYGE